MQLFCRNCQKSLMSEQYVQRIRWYFLLRLFLKPHFFRSPLKNNTIHGMKPKRNDSRCMVRIVRSQRVFLPAIITKQYSFWEKNKSIHQLVQQLWFFKVERFGRSRYFSDWAFSGKTLARSELLKAMQRFYIKLSYFDEGKIKMVE